MNGVRAPREWRADGLRERRKSSPISVGGGKGGRTENSSRDQSEYREIPGLNYVNIKRTGVIPEAQYGDHLKNCVVA